MTPNMSMVPHSSQIGQLQFEIQHLRVQAERFQLEICKLRNERYLTEETQTYDNEVLELLSRRNGLLQQLLVKEDALCQMAGPPTSAALHLLNAPDLTSATQDLVMEEWFAMDPPEGSMWKIPHAPRSTGEDDDQISTMVLSPNAPLRLTASTQAATDYGYMSSAVQSATHLFIPSQPTNKSREANVVSGLKPVPGKRKRSRTEAYNGYMVFAQQCLESQKRSRRTMGADAKKNKQEVLAAGSTCFRCRLLHLKASTHASRSSISTLLTLISALAEAPVVAVCSS